jgi:hypothetical protein
VYEEVNRPEKKKKKEKEKTHDQLLQMEPDQVASPDGRSSKSLLQKEPDRVDR